MLLLLMDNADCSSFKNRDKTFLGFMRGKNINCVIYDCVSFVLLVFACFTSLTGVHVSGSLIF